MLLEKNFETIGPELSHQDREGGTGLGAEVNIIYIKQPKKLYFSGILRAGKRNSVNKFSSKETKKFLFLKLFHLWRHLKNNQIKNFISELRSPSFISAIRSWNHSLESGVVS